jgi:choline dehydrogenase-like flavoprotein
VAARHLAEAGFSVVCLEQGGWENAGDFPATSSSGSSSPTRSGARTPTPESTRPTTRSSAPGRRSRP